LEEKRKEFDRKINSIVSVVKHVSVDSFGEIYREVIEECGRESFQDLYKSPNTKQINRDMYLRLKLQNINEL